MAPGAGKGLRLTPRQKFSLIEKVGGDAKLLCRIAGVSRSGYYKWQKTKDQLPKDWGDYLLIKSVFEKGKARWGWRTTKMKLESEYGIVMNHKKVQRIMAKYDLVTKVRKMNPYRANLKKTREHRFFPNLLDRQFSQTRPGTVFCTDITYLPYRGSTAYLSAVKDIASREIVGWTLSGSLHMELVLSTLDRLGTKLSGRPALIHSDQGFHYTSPRFVRKVKSLNLSQSMSRKGTCVDNAPMESFFGHFKDEVDYRSCATFEELEKLTSEYIDYYNSGRNQWNLGKLAPQAYRDILLVADN